MLVDLIVERFAEGDGVSGEMVGPTRRFHWALVLTVVVVCECAVLAANRGRCPLTDWAARFTEYREANFDIYLPGWLARNNKAIFGTLFVVNELIVLWRWLVQP